jgi:solute carrier family 25 protein 33/36
VVGFAASKAIYFGLYGASRDALMPCTFVGVAAVAAACSAVSVTLTCPIWMLKTTLQLQGHPGRLGSAVRCLRPFGVRGLFKGLTASYLGIGESALQLALYEYGRAAAGPQWTPVTVVVSKVVACAVMYPHEVLRTRMRQLDDTAGLRLGVVSTARRIVAREGWSALYGGMGVHMLRAVPNAMLVFGTLEAIHALNNND